MDIVLPPVVDPVGEALHFLRLSGTFYCRSEFTAPWALEIPPIPHSLMLHVLTSGSAWLEADGCPPRRVQSGDLILAPHGTGHTLASQPGVPAEKLFDIPRIQKNERYDHIRLGGGGEPANLICAFFQFDHPAADHLVQLLPPLIVVDGCHSPHADWVLSTLRLMSAEARELRPGFETVITRLSDVLVIHTIRCWVEQDPSSQTRWLGALRDPQIGRIIGRIHRQPEAPWTLDTLAAECAMSRSAFAAKFTELVGEPAMRYVTRWRMLTALTWLRDSDLSVGEIGRKLGYDSEAAFNRAFRRYVGSTPGAARKRSD